MTKKGISLPVEMIVIIAIAMLVLVVIAAMFIPGVLGPIGETRWSVAQGQLCSAQLSNCAAEPGTFKIPFDRDGNGNIDASEQANPISLAEVCTHLGLSTATGQDGNPCRIACGCPE